MKDIDEVNRQTFLRSSSHVGVEGWENTFIRKWDEKHLTFGKSEVRAKDSNLWYEVMVDETGKNPEEKD